MPALMGASLASRSRPLDAKFCLSVQYVAVEGEPKKPPNCTLRNLNNWHMLLHCTHSASNYTGIYYVCMNCKSYLQKVTVCTAVLVLKLYSLITDQT